MRYARINTEHIHTQRFAINKNTKEQNESKTFDKRCGLDNTGVHFRN